MALLGPPDPSAFPPGWTVTPWSSPPRHPSCVMLRKDGEMVQAFGSATEALWYARLCEREGYWGQLIDPSPAGGGP